MISIILGGICFVIALYSSYSYIFGKPENTPPGPPRIPWLGSYLLMLILDHKHLHRAVERLCEYYKSSIIGFYLGNFYALVISDLENTKKALNHREFDGRPDFLAIRLRHPDFDPVHGIFFREGESWLEQKRFALRYLRDFGFGRRHDKLEKETEIQIAHLIDIVKNGPKYEHEKMFAQKGKLLMPYAIGPTIGNCFIACLINEALPREAVANIYHAVQHAFVFQRRVDAYGKLYGYLPSIAKWFPKLSDFQPARESSVKLYDVFKKIVDEQIETYDETHERHFIDMYIRKIKEHEANPDEKTYFAYDQLILTCIDFAFPSLSAVSTTLSFLFTQMQFNPEVQQKIHDEIDHVVGQGRAPNLDDRINLPYTEACIREILRYETLVPTNVAHKAMTDTEFAGYSIPKGTLVFTIMDAAMHDPSAWNNPNEFRPERFLDSSGKLCLSKDISVPFGAGKRLCAGETFARNMLFLSTAAILQAFTIRMPAGEKPIKFSENMTGLIRSPKDHWIELTAR